MMDEEKIYVLIRTNALSEHGQHHTVLCEKGRNFTVDEWVKVKNQEKIQVRIVFNDEDKTLLDNIDRAHLNVRSWPSGWADEMRCINLKENNLKESDI